MVDGVAAVVDGALKAAEVIADALGGFLVLTKDIAAGPGQWLGNLAAAIEDGIQNHLWKAFQTAVREWFKSKVVELLGIGGMVLQVLVQGGIDLAKISKMAWEELKGAIPIALGAILVEKLVSMIVPAAGAVIAIIEGLQAAWGTLQRIVAAMSAFIAFLKAVKNGGAGPKFAQMLALAAVVVLDFVSNWLLRKLRKAAVAIGNKLKALAKKLARKFKGRGRKTPPKQAKTGKPDKSHGQKKGQKEDKTKKEKRQKLERGLRKAQSRIRRRIKRGARESAIKNSLPGLARSVGLKRLWLEERGQRVELHGQVNPKGKKSIGYSAEGKLLFEAKIEAQKIVQQEIATKHSPQQIANTFSKKKANDPKVILPTAEEQIAFGQAFGASKNPIKHGQAMVGGGLGQQVSWFRFNKNGIFVPRLGTSQEILSQAVRGRETTRDARARFCSEDCRIQPDWHNGPSFR